MALCLSPFSMLPVFGTPFMAPRCYRPMRMSPTLVRSLVLGAPVARGPAFPVVSGSGGRAEGSAWTRAWTW
jgi:hypothetical protein